LSVKDAHQLCGWLGWWYNHWMTTGKRRHVIVRSKTTNDTGFAKVFAFLRDQLLEGTIRSGDRLVPERDLAAQLGVSRPIVREALRALSMMGAVEIQSRVGTIVRQPDVSVLGDFFAYSLAQRKGAIEDVMQARIAIECQAVRLACQRSTTFDFESLGHALEKIEATIDDPIKGSLADHEFHAALVRAAKSDTLASLYTAMASILMRSHRDRRAMVEMDAGIKQYLIADHRRIFEAVAAHDEAAADRLLRDHFSIGDSYRHQGAVEPTQDTSPVTKRAVRAPQNRGSS
jgi:GntR family transcriptional regulator, transcriptional repressor for pyruvate dehydrogenase complex